MNIHKASFTVEAALLIPVFLFAFLSLFYLHVYLHNTNTLTCASCEMAVTGRTHAVETLLAEDSPVPAAASDDTERSVTFSYTPAASLPGTGETEIRSTYCVLNPSEYVRFVQLKEELSGAFSKHSDSEKEGEP